MASCKDCIKYDTCKYAQGFNAENDIYPKGGAETCATFKPTSDVVEVKHGEWLKRHNERTCSECRFIYYNSNDDFNYCPNCGAKMYGKPKGEKDG